MTCVTIYSADQHTEEMLRKLSDNYMQKMDYKQLSDYLMSACQYLKMGDLSGWKAKFSPEPTVPAKPQKRLRQSPCTAAVRPEAACKECHSEEVIDDVKNGQIVCTACGLIQLLVAFKGDTAHCSYNRMRSIAPVYIHRYSRLVNFLTIIRFMEGDSQPVIPTELKSRLRAELDGKTINGYEVRKALCRLKLSRRYLRHAMSFVREWNKNEIVTLPGDMVMKMIKMFRVIEFNFDKRRRRLWPGRKTFFSYKFILYQLLHEVGRGDLAGPHLLLKSKSLLLKQMGVYKRVCQYTGFTCTEKK